MDHYIRGGNPGRAMQCFQLASDPAIARHDDGLIGRCQKYLISCDLVDFRAWIFSNKNHALLQWLMLARYISAVSGPRANPHNCVRRLLSRDLVRRRQCVPMYHRYLDLCFQHARDRSFAAVAMSRPVHGHFQGPHLIATWLRLVMGGKCGKYSQLIVGVNLHRRLW